MSLQFEVEFGKFKMRVSIPIEIVIWALAQLV